jgi:Amt family ammonium transporter
VLATGIFADGTYGDKWNGVNGTVKGLLYGDPGQLVAQVLHAVVGAAWAFGVTYLIFTVAKRYMQIRVSEAAELQGLDEPEFGAVCYPDFVLATTTTGSYAGAHSGPPSTAPASHAAADPGPPGRPSPDTAKGDSR